MKRVERKQLKGDEFVSGIGKFLDILKRWQKESLVFVGVLILLALVFLGIMALKNRSFKKDSQTVGEILSLSADLNNKPENLAKLEKLAGNGKFSRVAYIELAAYWLEKNDLAKAETLAGKVKPSPKDIFYYQTQDLVARIAIKKKDYAKALEIYKRIEEEKPKFYPLDAVLFRHGEVLELKGDVQGALAVFKRIQDEYNQTAYGSEAAQKLSKLQSLR